MTIKLPLFISVILSLSFIGFKNYNNLKTYSNYTEALSGTGVAATFNLDRTGSPISNGLFCGQCHSGAFNSAAISITVRDGMANPVTQYTPGETYTLEYNISSNNGLAKGFQSVVLGTENVQAGNLSNPSIGAAIIPLNERQYIEHTTTSLSTGSTIFTAEWTAPINLTDVTFYASGIVGDGNNATSGDQAITPIALTLTRNTLSDTSFKLKNNIKLFPNPSNGKFNLDLGKVYKNITIEITNINGQIVKTISTENQKTIRFNLNVNNGLYFARINTDYNNQETLKLSIN